jgi:regulatory protein
VRRIPRSRASESSEPPDAYTAALVLLGQRELSAAQLRARLLRRGCPADAVDLALSRLTRDHTLDDGRVARAAARVEAQIRGRGPARVRQKLLALGIAPDVAQEAVANAFLDVDEAALLEQALARRLRGKPLDDLDDRARARLVRSLVGQGFSAGAVMKRVLGA